MWTQGQWSVVTAYQPTISPSGSPSDPTGVTAVVKV